jgi:hypothetical protein
MILFRIRWVLIARMKPSQASPARPDAVACRDRPERFTSHRQSQCVRRDTMGGERQYTMLRLSPVMRVMAVRSQRSPATLRLKVAVRLEQRRALVVKRVPLETAPIVVKRIPDCPAPGHSRATRPIPARSSDDFPCRGLRGADPTRCRMPSDLFMSNTDPSPARTPRIDR